MIIDWKKIVKKNITENIKQLLIEARNKIVKSVNLTMVYTYFEIWKIIIENEQNWEERAEYWKETLKIVSEELTKEFWKGFSERNLKYMRKFYNIYWKGQTASAKSLKWKKIAIKPEKIDFQLSWSHYVFLMRLDEIERNFYEKESILNNWSLRELKRHFDSSLFDRVLLSKDKSWALKDDLEKYHFPEKPEDLMKNPYILEFLGLEENSKYSETQLEGKIIEHLEKFLLEMWKGFTFVWRQKRFTFDEQHFFVDLVFYNRLLKCFVIIDLKIWKIKHQDIWQMQMYVNYYDRFIKTSDENPTIGILLSKDKNESLVEITLPKNSNIFSKEYKLYLPTKEELLKEINKI